MFVDPKSLNSAHLHFVLLFWNQVLTWASVIFKFLAICARSVLARYFLGNSQMLFAMRTKTGDLPVCETSFPIHRFEVERTRFLAFSSLAVFCSDRDGRFGVEGKGRLEQKKNI